MMKSSVYGLLLLLGLMLPPAADFLESIMITHMHMQMPLLVISGIFMAKFFQNRFTGFFSKWNENGVPGILLFSIIMVYWSLPRTMDEALTLTSVEVFKFISLPFLAGVPLRDSWLKLSSFWKHALIIFFTILFLALGWLYIWSPVQLCNNYLVIEQITLGWGFISTAVAMVVYLIYSYFMDFSKYE
ncbi:hypothetical protein KM915_14515 [Cytobacillus oceanisediminis]|uniref:hypothetical protein n=1 Tax=Cytobacillus oceanisediminis TaxID=665099 RepID=UPI001C242EA2|nr:hypothetical protein [Cytobacillus oceanisediminis]MBU8731261.1 hypothetical protein [Cytobacillus oceanisediminis]